MDTELEELASLALINAFYSDFSTLVNGYLKVAKGLPVDEFEARLCGMANVYSCDDSAKSVCPRIATFDGKRFTKHDSIISALATNAVTEVSVQDRKVFVRRNGEWYFMDKPR